MGPESGLLFKLGFKDYMPHPFVEITEISITGEDRENNVYSGNLKFIDHVEHGFEGESEWEARPGTQVHEISHERYLFDVNPVYKEKDPFLWGKDSFTLSPSVDSSFRFAIMNTLLFYNPNLPHAD